MKRIVFFVLVLAVILSACGGSAPTPDFAAVEIVSNDAAAFTITGIDPSAKGPYGSAYAVKVLCENKTDKPVLFTWENTAVNGFMVDAFWSERLLPGTKANSTIYFDNAVLKQNGITTVENITFNLLVMPEVGTNEYDRFSAFIDGLYTFEP